MSIERFFTTAVTIVTPGSTVGRYGDSHPDWGSATEVDTVGWLTEIGTSEEIGARDAVVSGWRLFLPAGTTITASDRVTAAGDTYEVTGEPHEADTPDGGHHIEAELRKVVG